MTDTLRAFSEIYAIAARRKGGTAALEALLPRPRPRDELVATPDHRWLATFSRIIFQTGLNWQMIETKWPAFEEAFEGFDIGRNSMMSDDDLDRHLKNAGIVRHAQKILSVRDNAIWLKELAEAHGSAAAFFADWPSETFAELLWLMKSRGSRLGGTSGAYALRLMGVDSFIPGGDALRALEREGVVSGKATSRRDLAAIQAAFNAWRAETGRPLMQIGRVLACSID